jgi:hypothetical protein
MWCCMSASMYELLIIHTSQDCSYGVLMHSYSRIYLYAPNSCSGCIVECHYSPIPLVTGSPLHRPSICGQSGYVTLVY